MFYCLALQVGRVAWVKQQLLRQLSILIKLRGTIHLFCLRWLQGCNRPYRKKAHHLPSTAGVRPFVALFSSSFLSLFVSTPYRAGPCGVHRELLFSGPHVWQPP